MKWKRIVTGIQKAEGYRLPRGWGLSYYELCCDKYVIHPIPLNWIVAGLRRLVIWLKVPYWEKKERAAMSKKMNEAWKNGWEDGWRDCTKLSVSRNLEERIKRIKDE